MTTQDHHPRPVGGRRWTLAALLAASVLLAACSGGDDGGRDASASDDRGPNAVVPPTLAGGVELTEVDPSRVLVGDGLAFGTPLPSEQLAAEAYTTDPEVSSALARRVYALADGRQLGDVLVLALDGEELFDEDVLDAFVRGVIGTQGDGSVRSVTIAGRDVLRSRTPERSAIGFLEGNLLVVVRGPVDGEVEAVVERQLAAIAAGAPGSPEPLTPLVDVTLGAAFVDVPTVAFQVIPPPEEEPPPEPPTLPGATGLEGRYGVVAGERRTVVWVFTLDPAVYPSAEALEPALAALASSRAGGAPAEGVEVVDRVVQRATGTGGAPSARGFRHHRLAVLVEGMDPAQVDAVVSAWISVLAAAGPS